MASRKKPKKGRSRPKKRSVSQQRVSQYDLPRDNVSAVDKYHDKDRRRFDPSAWADTPPLENYIYVDRLVRADRYNIRGKKKVRSLPQSRKKRPYWKVQAQFTNKKARICNQRRARRKILFQLKRAGKGIAGPKRIIRSAISDIICRR